MLTILNAVELSTEYLFKKNVDSPRINAELLLAHILNCKRMDLYLRFDQPLSNDEKDKYRTLIKRRGDREPLQYIIGNVEFYGLEFKVNTNVLIPRSETELLVEEIIKSLNGEFSYNILDIGTGSGNIPIAIAHSVKNVKIVSIDKSREAIELAKFNAEVNKVSDRVELQTIDVNDFSALANNKFDIIVSNPPYVSIDEYEKLEMELVKYEPKEALTDNYDGLEFYRLISSISPKLLRDKGKLFFEIGLDQAEKVEELLVSNGFKNIRIVKDYQNINRIIYGELS